MDYMNTPGWYLGTQHWILRLISFRSLNACYMNSLLTPKGAVHGGTTQPWEMWPISFLSLNACYSHSSSILIALNLYLKDRLWPHNTEKAEVQNHKTWDIAVVSATEKDWHKTETGVGMLLQRDRFSTSFWTRREKWQNVHHYLGQSKSLETSYAKLRPKRLVDLYTDEAKVWDLKHLTIGLTLLLYSTEGF